MEHDERKSGTFRELRVYNDSYNAMAKIFETILPSIPREERFDLYDQLLRSSKAIPRLIAEGHAKRHQVKGFIKYIYDAMAEANETIVSISQFKDLYADISRHEICDELIGEYDKIGRQLFCLQRSWENYHSKTNK